METATLTPPAEHDPALKPGTPLVLVDYSPHLHLPSHHLIGRGRGGHHTTITEYLLDGYCPLRWTAVCGRRGRVILYYLGRLPGTVLELSDFEVCPECRLPAIELKRYSFERDGEPEELPPPPKIEIDDHHPIKPQKRIDDLMDLLDE